MSTTIPDTLRGSQPLQSKNTRTLLTWLPVVMLAGSVFLYFILVGHIRHMKRQQLELKQENVWSAFVGDPQRAPLKLAGEYEIAPGAMEQDVSDSAELSRLTETNRIGGKEYHVTTYISAREYKHLLVKISVAEAVIFALLLWSIVIINRAASRRLWKPFYATMTAIGQYDISQDRRPRLAEATGIEEFDRLNQSLLALIDHVNHAYHNQKQFTENASHELQTPLAIIRSKVELLTEVPGLNEDSAQLLQEISEANERLSQMNKNLLLLTRIENGQYPEISRINLSQLLQRLTTFFQDYYQQEVARTIISIEREVYIQGNPSLVEVLMSNLLRNAYVHNIPGGWVEVRLIQNALVIENSGPLIEGDPVQLFDRFRKGRVDSRTTGLGLALVRQISQLHRYEVRYFHEAGRHQLSLVFT